MGVQMWTPDEIYTAKGQVVRVSPEDWRNLAQWFWNVGAKGYVQRNIKLGDGKRKTSAMHREVFGCFPHDGVLVDHKNNDPLDNRRENLRVATPSQNSWNRMKHKNGKSKFKGVSWCKKTQKWRACIRKNRIGKILGYFDVEEDAYAAYCNAASELHGEFANHGNASPSSEEQS
jgi:hypothetical protein